MKDIFLKTQLWIMAVLWPFYGRFMAVFTLEDGQIVLEEQIVWCENGTNKFFDGQIVWYLAVWQDGFLKTICPLRWTSQWQYDLNSHQTVKWLIFSPRGNGTSNRARFYGKFQHGGTQEEVSEIGEKQSEVFEKKTKRGQKKN